MNRGDEKERADAFVEIRFAVPVLVQFSAGRQKFGGCFALTPAINRDIANRAVGGVDNVDNARRQDDRGRRPGPDATGIRARR
jgi:hypothetical protein